MRDDWLRLAHVGMHPDRLRGLLADCSSPASVLAAIESGRVQVPDAARAAAAVAASARRTWLQAAGVRFIVRGDGDYPTRLDEVEDRPPFLFVKGTVPAATGVAIVGTRRCTRYGRDLAEAFGAAVSQAGWSVVSGLARGIDGAAHRGSLRGPGPGVAVLGCGIDRWYPTSHAGLGQALLDRGGAVMSEYPPGTTPTGWRFPPRNRIISGLAAVVVIVEAGVRGGALITANRALDHDRLILAVPGDVTRPSSEGCNLLIRDGAIPVLGPDDLIESLSLIIGQPPGPRSASGSATDADLDLPVTGITIDELAAAQGIEVSELLAELGRHVADGSVELRDGRAYPAHRTA